MDTLLRLSVHRLQISLNVHQDTLSSVLVHQICLFAADLGVAEVCLRAADVRETDGRFFLH